jgi:hypothetical protein
MMARFFYRLLLAFFIGIPVTLILLLMGVPVSGAALYAGLFGGVVLSYAPEVLAELIWKAAR